MLIKNQGRKLGRQIRRNTKLPLPMAMKIGKMLAQCKWSEINTKFPDHVRWVVRCECCGPDLMIGRVNADGSFHIILPLKEASQ